MLLSRSATIVVLVFVAVLASAQTSPAAVSPTADQEQTVEETDQQSPPANCPVTLPPSEGGFSPPSPVRSGIVANQFWFGTEKLWTALPADGVWRGSVPSKAGEFAYDDKLAWFRVHPTFSEKDEPLTITGKRLDGAAPSFTETDFFSGDDDYASGVGGISIPVFGCWQVTGHYKDRELTFSVWVTPRPEQKPSSVQVPYAPAIAPQRVIVDGETQAKSLVYKVTPEIPAEARTENSSGTVVLHAVIGTGGRPGELQYVSGPQALAQPAIDAVTWWQYRITVVNDEAVEVDTTIDVVFPPPSK